MKLTSRIKNLFCDHPASQNETYWQHAKFALSVAFYLFVSSVCLAFHAVFPFICPPKPYDLESAKKYLEERWEYRQKD